MIISSDDRLHCMLGVSRYLGQPQDWSRSKLQPYEHHIEPYQNLIETYQKKMKNINTILSHNTIILRYIQNNNMEPYQKPHLRWSGRMEPVSYVEVYSGPSEKVYQSGPV